MNFQLGTLIHAFTSAQGTVLAKPSPTDFSSARVRYENAFYGSPMLDRYDLIRAIWQLISELLNFDS